MNKNLLLPIGVLVIMVISAGVYFTTRGSKVTEEKLKDTVTNQQAAETETGNKETGVGCVAGTSKTVAGLKHTRTGMENHSIQGKSMDLCCWEQETSVGKRKLCVDSNETPVGYTYGIMWETPKSTGKTNKTMERYQKDGKSCQQFYNADGTAGPESCQ